MVMGASLTWLSVVGRGRRAVGGSVGMAGGGSRSLPGAGVGGSLAEVAGAGIVDEPATTAILTVAARMPDAGSTLWAARGRERSQDLARKPVTSASGRGPGPT